MSVLILTLNLNHFFLFVVEELDITRNQSGSSFALITVESSFYWLNKFSFLVVSCHRYLMLLIFQNWIDFKDLNV